MSMLVKVCRLDDVRDEITSVDVEGRKIMLIRKGENIYALDRICTHRYADLANGFITDDAITCPLHFAQFDISTGRVLSPPAEEDLKRYNVKISEGYIYIELV